MFKSYKRIILLLLLSTGSLFATTYDKMSTDELMSLRGNVSVENIEAFGAEISKRVHLMNDNDLRRYGIWEMIKGNSSKKGECSCTSNKQIPNKL